MTKIVGRSEKGAAVPKKTPAAHVALADEDTKARYAVRNHGDFKN